MDKLVKISGLFFFALITLMFLATADENNSTLNSKECKDECIVQKKESSKMCNSDYKECRSESLGVRKLCIESARSNLSLCKSQCKLIISNNSEKRDCLKECSLDFKFSIKECNFNYNASRSSCINELNTCKEALISSFNVCSTPCFPRLEINDSRDEFNFTISGSSCKESNGLYQQLCKGQYFRLMCSGRFYCQCAGFGNYTCPEDYQCVLDHGIVVLGRSHFTDGFVNHLGQKLGPIGLCGKPFEPVS